MKFQTLDKLLNELKKIEDNKIKLVVINNEISSLKKEMIKNSEEDYIANPKKIYKNVKQVIPENSRVKYLNELLFLKEMYS